MSGDGIEPGELLWIDPTVCRVSDPPDGFILHVVEVLGGGGEDPRRRRLVWVRGPVLDARGAHDAPVSHGDRSSSGVTSSAARSAVTKSAGSPFSIRIEERST